MNLKMIKAIYKKQTFNDKLRQRTEKGTDKKRKTYESVYVRYEIQELYYDYLLTNITS